MKLVPTQTSQAYWGIIHYKTASLTVNDVIAALDERESSSPRLVHLTSSVHHTLEIIESIDAVFDAADSVRLDSDFDYRLEIARQCCDVLEMSSSVSPKNVSGFVQYVAQEVWPPTRLLTILNVWLSSPKLMAAALDRYRPEIEVVAFGHIHYPKICRRQGRLLVNLGGFLNMVKAKVVEVNGQTLSVNSVTHRNRECRIGPVEETLSL